MGNINIDIPDELHKQLKVCCAMQDISIKDFIVQSLEEEIKKETEKEANETKKTKK
ncbi:MAG: toxin-antitoxin system HicB family antitoxin [Candidatus Woesearchaeota archaeon]